jgi:flagellar hook-basal body complex protein FliE
MSEITLGPINPNMQLPEIPRPPRGSNSSGGPSFSNVLRDAISTTNELQKQSDLDIKKLMTGEAQDLHSTLIAVQKADLSFQMMMQVRNKLVQAYQEIMRMPV